MTGTTALATAAPAGKPALVSPQAADENAVAVYLASLAPGSRRTMRGALDTVATMLTSETITDSMNFDWSQLRAQHTQAIRSALAARYAPATANKHLAALRGVLRECRRLGQISAEQERAACDLKAVRGERLPRGRALTAGELRGLFEACAADSTPAGRRDAAVLAVLYGCGLRRSELVSLDLADWDADTDALTVRAGKGAKARVTYTANGTHQALSAWLTARGTEPGSLFWPADRFGNVTSGRLSDQGLLRIAEKRAGQAAVQRFSPHDLRRSMISDLLDAGADISTAQRLAGHASVVTTQRYDRRGERAKQQAAGLLNVPYVEGDTVQGVWRNERRHAGR